MCWLSLLVLCLSLCVVHCHICMWEPHQRGPVDISMPGADVCYHVYGPCGANDGSLPPGSPVITLTGLSAYKVEFQQNLNHWYPQNPGYMIAEIAKSDNGTFTQFGDIIADFNAGDMVTQTNFTIKGQVPNFNCAACVLRVRYVSNNPLEPNPNFYQCADIAIQASN